MDHFNYKNGQLCAEDIPLREIAAAHGTPCYIYSRATLERHWHAFDDAFAEQPHLVCYAVKANSNLAILDVLARLGSGFDIVSIGELERVIKAGGKAGRIVFSGVGKRPEEMQRALELGIRCFNIESEAELERLSQVATAMGVEAPVALRVNPDVDAGTHPYISTGLKENKFGIPIGEALALYEKAADLPGLKISGIDCHIGSQLTELSPFLDALDRLLLLVDRLAEKGISIDHLDLGGGLGVTYRDETPPSPAEYARAVSQKLADRPFGIFIEPGRAIAANAGVLLTRVEYLKPTQEKDFAIVDAAMNDLIRPSLYQAWQAIIPVEQNATGRDGSYDIVGPVCETGDFLGKDRELSLSPGDLLAVRSSGAYGFTMASNYNSRPRAAEVMVDGNQAYLVRERETLADLYRGEHLIP
ncbi:diaminopimelate decarboxylase [Thiolapillus brandeum]|uniref:Diaminopimelate decarboxylase n=1 Tax=Thiolapillus brandeum TaxID=1076588 RepID=A0A7U6GGN5_9GAMM|nr:diaminopimelate decarboxylase [Thiolapillus brandeum]BAO43308.1 diaminopimelate decarboxylase [Thiolapillus brandeum]